MSKSGIRIADWAQRGVTGVLVVSTVYLAYKVTQGGGIVKEKIKGEQQERLERMENDLKKWRAEDAEKEKEAAAAKKD